MATVSGFHFAEESGESRRFEQIIGNSPALQSVLRQVELVGPTDSTVLILGETGVGKELIARAVHNVSARYGRPFIKLNCAAIPSELLESELFGHEKGAFTGAVTQRLGRFEAANGGTLFLDEVGDMPLNLQTKLLRVLQEREFERLGSTHTRRVDVRAVAATNQNLEQMVTDKQFRMDLYYRLNVFPIALPPLRGRREDIPLLVNHFVQKYSARMSKQISSIPQDAMDALVNHPWPGNIRELQNVIERAVIISKSAVLNVFLNELEPERAQDSREPAPDVTPPDHELPGQENLHHVLEEAARTQILRVLEACNGVISGSNGAAARLGIGRSTLQLRMQKLRIRRTHTGFVNR